MRRQGAQDELCLVNKVARRRVDVQRQFVPGAVGFEEPFHVVAQIPALRNIHRAAQQWDKYFAVENPLPIHLIGKGVHRGGVTFRRRGADQQFGKGALEPDVRLERHEREFLPPGAPPCRQQHALTRQDVEHRPVANVTEQFELALVGVAHPEATDQHGDTVQLAIDERKAVHEWLSSQEDARPWQFASLTLPVEPVRVCSPDEVR